MIVKYRELPYPNEIKLDTIQEVRGTIAKAMLHIRTPGDISYDLTLIRPKVRPKVSSRPAESLTALFDGLDVKQVNCLKIFGRLDSKSPQEIKWKKIEIRQSNDSTDIIQCSEIQGLPS
jgi:hypothetical protein